MKHNRLPRPRLMRLVENRSPQKMPEMLLEYENHFLPIRRSLGYVLTKERARQLSHLSSLTGQKMRLLVTRDGIYRMLN